jgi:alkylhydroperoxidase/carboxymuconolactone decarboxylase family protein YurZ
VEALRKHNDEVEATLFDDSKNLMDRKAREMVIVATCIALRDVLPHIQVHMHAAHKAGATPEEIMELINLVSRWAGNVAKVVGLEAWRATFRPDLPTIMRVSELR